MSLYSDIPPRSKFSVDERAQEVSEELNGTCTDLGDVLEIGEIDDVVLIAAVESIIYQCDCCGWWVERDTIDGDGVCEDCACDA